MTVMGVVGWGALVLLAGLSIAVGLSERVANDTKVIIVAINLASLAICGTVFRVWAR